MACSSFFGLPEQRESAAEKYRRALEQKAQKEKEVEWRSKNGAGGKCRDGEGLTGQKRKAPVALTEQELQKLRKQEEIKRLQQNRDFLSELTGDGAKNDRRHNSSPPPSRHAPAEASTAQNKKLHTKEGRSKTMSHGPVKTSALVGSKPSAVNAVNGSKVVNGRKPVSAGSKGSGRCPWCVGKGCSRCASTQGGSIAHRSSAAEPSKVHSKPTSAPPASRSIEPARAGVVKTVGKAQKPMSAGGKPPGKPLSAAGASQNRMAKANGVSSQRGALQKSNVRQGVPVSKQISGTTRPIPARMNSDAPRHSTQRSAAPSETGRQAVSSGGGSFFERARPSATSSSAAPRPRPDNGKQSRRTPPYGRAAPPKSVERLEGFVVDDEEEEEEDWRSAMRAITKYDPTKYKNDFDDRNMVAGFSDVQAEERRSARLGREADRKAEEEELARQKRKAELKKQLKAKKKKSSG